MKEAKYRKQRFDATSPMARKWQAISLLMLLIIVICSTFIYLLTTHTQQTLDRCINKQIASLRNIAMTHEEEKKRYYTTRIRNFLDYKLDPGKEKLLQAFAERNHEELLRLSKPYFKRIQAEDPFLSTMAWILPDNSNYLRVHAPTRKNDNISALRPDIVHTNRNRKEQSGYVIVENGLRYSVVEPVFYKETYLGALQFGMNGDAVLQRIEQQLSLTLGLLIPNGNFVTKPSSLLPPIRYKDHTLQSLDVSFFKHWGAMINWNLDRQEIIFDDREHIFIKALDLLNHMGQVQGKIYAAIDISDFTKEAREKLFFSFLLGAILLILSFLILYFNFGSLLENIISLNRSLQLKTKEWEKTFDAMGDIVTVQDKHMRIVRANRSARNFFHNERETILGKNCYEIFRGISVPCSGCPTITSIQNTESHSETIVHKNLGKVFTVTSSPILDDEGNLQYLVHTAKDITEQKKMEKELFQAHKVEAIGNLASGIAHDFNNILSAIIGYSQLAKMKIAQPKKAMADIDEVLKAGRRATDLVKQILNISRKKEEQDTPIEPHLIVKEALTMLRSTLPSTIKIHSNIDSNCGYLLADPTNLHQIVVNLCTNALHAMEDEKGVLEVSLQPKYFGAKEIEGESTTVSPGSFAVLEISDTGKGMNQAEQAHIFEPYFTTKKPGKGTGMGLAVVHEIVRRYQGFIRVQSVLGQGSRFSVHLPLFSSAASSLPTMKEKEEALPRGSERILVVDDERAIAEMFKLMLETTGYDVTICVKSTEALRQVQLAPNHFDLIITDQTMPDLTGADLAREILLVNEQLPIILCTGYSSTLSRKEAMEIGIAKFLYKPVDRSTLLTVVRQIADRYKK